MKTDAERRAFVEKVRQENETHYGGPARRTVDSFLSAGLPHPWTYVYELTQNALDAGAQRVLWKRTGKTVLFQHDGSVALEESHVRGIASLGASTKGLSHVGFMGVGFKSIFARFRTARVSGFGFRFRFDVGSLSGDLGQTITQWFDTLRPHWDEDARDPDSGYTTAFSLERPVDSTSSVANDLERISSPSDPTPLAVLALRGLKHVRVDDIEWNLAVDEDGVVVVSRHSSNEPTPWRWKSFVSRYRPHDDAMRRFLEVRRQTHEQVGDDGQRTNREVVGLVPLDDKGLPNPPPGHGRVYATLPTQVQVPFGFHLQADWFVDIDRQNLRDVDGNAWQELIVRQVPDIVRQFLVWLTGQSEDARKRGYRALCDPNTDDGLLSNPFQALRGHFVDTLAGENVVPIHGVGSRRFRTPEGVSRLPGRFSVDFGRHPEWRPDLLFGCDLMDEELLSRSATGFFTWLGWGGDIDRNNVPWPDSLPQWWNSLPERTRADALFALWHGVQDLDWLDAPVVPTEAGTWVRMSDIRWLDEALPTASNPGGAVVTEILADSLPSAGERVPPSIRASVEKSDSEGARHFQSNRSDVQLSSLVERALDDIEGDHDLRLVSLLEWALSRGINRQDLVPWVLTEQGATRPADALLADPLVEDARSRQAICPDKSALVKDYELIDDRRAVVRFLEQLGVYSGDPLREQKTHLSRYDTGKVARILGAKEREVRVFQPANVDGYTVLDYDFPFRLDDVDLDALQTALSREHIYLRDKGHPEVRRTYRRHYTRSVPGTAAWVRSLQSYPWVLCTDGQRRKPADVLLEPAPDFEDAPIGKIDASLADRLKGEGVRFGSEIQKSPALRRLSKRGAEDLPDSELADLLREACSQVESGDATSEDLVAALNDVKLRGVPLERVVQRTGAGSGQRSDLEGWVVALADVEPPLAAAVRALPLSPSIPETTTGRHALGYLHDIWTKQPKVEAIRGSLAAAYRYVLDDVDSGKLPDEEWQQALAHARVYGQIGWHAISGALVVADVQSPLILRFLPESRTIVASAHLGDNDDQVRRVARALGLGLLSDDVKVNPGPLVDDPPYVRRLQVLVKMLSSLEDRRELQGIVFHENILLQVGGNEHDISAYVYNETLLLTGESLVFAPDAAQQLVAHFRLGQRGHEVPYLTAALLSLDNEDLFHRNLKVTADGLGVEVPKESSELAPSETRTKDDETEWDDHLNGDDYTSEEIDDDESDRRAGEPRAPAGTGVKVDHTIGGGQTASRSGAEDGRGRSSQAAARHGDGGTTQLPRNGGASGRAADQFGLFVVPSARDEHESEGERQHRASGRWKDDRKARQAVIEYEENRGWSAREMSDNNPGFDVESVSDDDENQIVRRIEVKGVQRMFDGDASVLLSSRQVHDALKEHGHGVEYWLYVVDSTETESPRVLAIPWTQHRSGLRYGFYAHVWARMAEQATDRI